MDDAVVMVWSVARNRGLRRYFNGEPCSAGHLAERHVVSRVCVECLRIAQSQCKRRRRTRIAMLRPELPYVKPAWLDGILAQPRPTPAWFGPWLQSVLRELRRPL